MRTIRNIVPALFSAFLFGLIACAALAQIPDRKVALVIGNSDYEFAPSLTNPANDASDIAASLGRLDFEVTLLINQSDTQLRSAIRVFSKTARSSDISVVYYAGHGIEIDKTNYLIPVNAELQGDRDADFEAVRLSDVLHAISGGDGISLMLVDACRDNPFASTLKKNGTTRSIGTGLVRVNPTGGVLPGGVLISYAAREGEFAFDGEGRNSPYAKGLLDHLEEPGLEISKFFRKVRDSVFEITGGKQEPFTYGSLPGKDIFLAGIPKTMNTALSGQSTTSDQKSFIALDFVRAEQAKTLAAWTEFLDRHGENESNAMVALARERIQPLQLLADRESASLESEPWLVPSAGFNSLPLKLTNSERILVQKSLNYLGLDTGGIDGSFGPMTRSAIQAARYNLGLTVSNKLDIALLRRLPNVPVLESMVGGETKTVDLTQLPPTNERRLVKAIQALGAEEYIFDYFQGHLYIVVFEESGTRWTSANEKARRAGGYLVTVSDASENRFLYDLFSQDDRFILKQTNGSLYGPMIGLHQFDRSSEPAGGWAWANGEPISFTGWSRGNPDNYKNRQHYASFYWRSGLDNAKRLLWWDDVKEFAPGFIIEID